MHHWALAVLLCVCVLTLGFSQATASVVTFDTSTEFSGGPWPQGPSPWLIVTYDDNDSSGAVSLNLRANSLVGTEFVSGLYLNVADGIDPNALLFTQKGQTGTFDLPAINLGTNQFKADGGDYFDIFLDFTTSGGVNHRFTDGDAITYVITGLTNLTVASFDVACVSDGKPGIYNMAAHIQGIGDGTLSAWVSAPEPVSAALLVLGCTAMIRRRR